MKLSPSLLTPQHVIVQGITGRQGTFHTTRMKEAGTQIVGGTSPGKGGQSVNGIPIYDNVAALKKDFFVDCSVVFVPASFAKAALLEAIDEHIPLIVCITEGIPIHDMLLVKTAADQAGVTLIGPNCPGILIPSIIKLGIIPKDMGLPGTVGIVSRSGTLTYEVMSALSLRGIGQKYVIGIGGDRIHGIGFIECLDLFEQDEEVSSIVLIGEIGGTSEQQAAKHIATHITKPIYAYVAGHSAPPNIQLGHAGAIFGDQDESAAKKIEALARSRVYVFSSTRALTEALK